MRSGSDKQVKKKSRQTERKILHSAERLFGRQGYSGTSIHDIAEEAGVNSALIFYYFSSKQKLYTSLFEEKYSDFKSKLAVIFAGGGTARGKLERFIAFHVRYLFQNMHMSKILMRELIGFGEKGALPIRQCFDEVQKPLQEIIREGVDSGEFRPVDPSLLSTALLGAMRAFLTRRLITRRAIEEKLIVQGILNLFLHGILANGGCKS